MREIVIIGGGGSSRDIIELIEDMNRQRPTLTIAGILDDDAKLHGSSICDVPVVGPITPEGISPEVELVIGIASSRNRSVKKQVFERLGFAPNRFATLVHPSASVSPRARIGEGSVILQNVVIGPKTELGRHVLVCAGTTIGHDAQVGDYVSMAPHVGISGNVIVGPSAYIGSGARFREGITVGAGSLVGIGAVVVSNINDGATAFGNPARMYR